MFRFFLGSSVWAVAKAGTLSIAWSDCGSKHGKTTGLSPTSIQTGTKATITVTGTVDEDVTSAHIAATVSALGTKLTDCSGDGKSDIVCTLPLGVGTITLPALPFPLAKGTLSLPVVVETSAAIPPSLANVDIHLTAEDQNGESATCLDVHTAASVASASNSTSAGIGWKAYDGKHSWQDMDGCDKSSYPHQSSATDCFNECDALGSACNAVDIGGYMCLLFSCNPGSVPSGTTSPWIGYVRSTTADSKDLAKEYVQV